MSVEILIFILIFAFVNIVLAFYLLGKEVDKPCYYPDALKNYEYFKNIEKQQNNEVINMQKKYEVTLKEERTITISVNALTKDQAEAKVFEMYENDKLNDFDFDVLDVDVEKTEEIADD